MALQQLCRAPIRQRIWVLKRRSTRQQRWKSSIASSSTAAATVEDNSQEPPLLELRQARLGYPGGASRQQPLTPPIDLIIAPPSQGGHALLGRNGSGKSLIGQTIVSRGHADYLQEGLFLTGRDKNWQYSNAIAHVSFDSHQELLNQGDSTYKAITGGGGNLTKAAQFLVVRFGLYPLLIRDVRTLSTGEIRKVLLVRALANRPKLLILDNAFDGLDVASREVLKDLVEKTIRGFTQDILVQGINSQSTAHTQILLMTHRPEELVDEVQVVSWYDQHGGNLITQQRDGRSGLELLEMAFNVEEENTTSLDSSFDWEHSSLPPMERVRDWWMKDRKELVSSFDPPPLVQAKNLSIHRGEATLLHDLNWTIRPGERWLVGGGNGAGKSTLSRLLARPEHNETGLHISSSTNVAWVSTERHMELAKSDELARDVLLQAAGVSSSSENALVVAEWLGISEDSLLDLPFSQLSQGEQKLVLVASAIAAQPSLLVLDEPGQGLDGVHRQRVLAVVNRICQATDMSLVYITHHLEELLPSVTHALHLKERRDSFNGLIENYKPEEL
jgi:molybdate transport system ATP-binding protein